MATPHMSFQGQIASVQATRVKTYDALAHPNVPSLAVMMG